MTTYQRDLTAIATMLFHPALRPKRAALGRFLADCLYAAVSS